MSTLEIVLSFITSGGIAGVIVVWITKKWVGLRITESVKNEYNENIEQLKADLKANNDIALERLKADLLVQEKKISTRYSILHEKRIDAIVKLYILLNRAKNRATIDIELAKKKPEEFKKILSNHRREYSELHTHFEENKLYLSKALVGIISGVIWYINDPRILSKYVISEAKKDDPNFESFQKLVAKWEEGYTNMIEALECIEEDFRMLLGVEVEQSYSL